MEYASTPPKSGKSHAEMGEAEFQQLVAGVLGDCENYVESELSPARAEATDYYNAQPFGNEEVGRSQVILSEVRDGIDAAMPPFLRLITGPVHPVEFEARNPAGEAGARQATEYVRAIIERTGILELHAAAKDALTRKLGIIKWYWEGKDHVSEHTLEGISPEQLALIEQEAGIEILEQTPDEHGLLTLRLRRTEPDGDACFAAVPPDEFWFTRETRKLGAGLGVFHVRDLTKGELVELGISEADIEAFGQRASAINQSEESIARMQAHQAPAGIAEAPDAGEANERIRYAEGVLRVDFDGDGIAELRRVCAIGPSFHVVHNEPTDEIPFAVFTPRPEPHTLVGGSEADVLMDLQRIKSSVLRATLDSLAASIFPRMAYVENQVSVSDVLNTAIGAPIRMRQQGAVQAFEVPFVGREAFPMLAYLDDVVERRTGRAKGTQGLDGDALQSTTAGAAEAVVQASNERSEVLCRLFAETLLKPLYRGLLKLLQKHQPRAKVARLLGEWVEIDPRTWDTDMAVVVNVAIGAGNVATKLQVLDLLAQKMEQVFQTVGFDNPLFTLHQYRAVIAEALQLRGWRNVGRFMQEIPADWKPPAPAAPPPDPAVLLAQGQLQLEQARAQTQAQQKQLELQLRQQEQQAQMQLEQLKLQNQLVIERQKIEAQMEIEMKKLELEYAVKIDTETLKANVAAQANELRVSQEHDRAERELAMRGAQMEQDAVLQTRKQDLDAGVQHAQLEAAREQAAAQHTTPQSSNGERA